MFLVSLGEKVLCYGFEKGMEKGGQTRSSTYILINAGKFSRRTDCGKPPSVGAVRFILSVFCAEDSARDSGTGVSSPGGDASLHGEVGAGSAILQ